MELTERERRAIQGQFSAGVTRCTSQIEKLSRTQWGLMSTGSQQMTAVGMLSWFRRNKEKHYAVKFSSTSELLIEVLFLYAQGSAEAVCDVVTRPYREKMSKLSNLVTLTVGEVSNILGHGIVGALADAIEVPIILSVPQISEGPKVDLLADAFKDYDGRKDTLLLSQVELYSMSLKAECTILFILDTKSIKKYVRKIPVN
ncbi:MAG: hypothetical protein ABIJ96_05035 [Elusimicrobiota bacterium]